MCKLHIFKCFCKIFILAWQKLFINKFILLAIYTVLIIYSGPKYIYIKIKYIFIYFPSISKSLKILVDHLDISVSKGTIINQLTAEKLRSWIQFMVGLGCGKQPRQWLTLNQTFFVRTKGNIVTNWMKYQLNRQNLYI